MRKRMVYKYEYLYELKNISLIYLTVVPLF